jgi:hypothetical protein
MNCCNPFYVSREAPKYKIVKSPENKFIVYVRMMDNYKILCISSSMATCGAMLDKYKKDPGGFSFRRF